MAVLVTKIGNTGKAQVVNDFSPGLESDMPAGHPEKALQLVIENVVSNIRRDM